MIYLDHAATALLKPVGVENAVVRAMRTMASPGRGGYQASMRAADTVYGCRELAARLFHLSEPEHVVFTMNATHALNIAIRTLAREGSRVVVSGFEHNAVTRPLHALGAQLLVAGRRLFDPDDTLRAFADLLPGSDLAVCTVVSNVFGYILPVWEIAELCARNGVPLILDASQAAGVLDLDFPRLGAEFLAMPGHKGLLGPQGTGLLLCRSKAEPLLFGGSGSESRSQEMPADLPERLEAGTQNVCGIAGLAAGIEYVLRRGVRDILRHERQLLSDAVAALQGRDCRLFTRGEGLQSGVLSLCPGRLECEELAELLDERGVCVRSGLHCAPLAHESAGTLRTGTLRLSFSPLLSREQLNAACKILGELLG